MILLSKEEAISLVLSFSKNNSISSKTKLNKLLARLNLFMIPIDIDFDLNKYGSYNAELDCENTDFYEIYEYNWKGHSNEGLKLTQKGKLLSEQVIEKILNILNPDEFKQLKESIYSLSILPADEISEDEHGKLLVDTEDRHKLVNRINSVCIDLLDLNESASQLKEDNLTELRLSALIEYCFSLSKYLKDKRFKNLEDRDYDYDSRMIDYYFLYILEKITIPFIKEQLGSDVKNGVEINKHYQYFTNFARKKYVFSLDNPDLRKIVT